MSTLYVRNIRVGGTERQAFLPSSVRKDLRNRSILVLDPPLQRPSTQIVQGHERVPVEHGQNKSVTHRLFTLSPARPQSFSYQTSADGAGLLPDPELPLRPDDDDTAVLETEPELRGSQCLRVHFDRRDFVG